MNIDAAVSYLAAHYSGNTSSGRCAMAIREALQAAGLALADHPANAKDYGPCLLHAGFTAVCSSEDGDGDAVTGFAVRKGDIAVIQPYAGGNPAGHITMYSGTRWRSDFVQNDMWSGPGYRDNEPPVTLYRPPA